MQVQQPPGIEPRTPSSRARVLYVPLDCTGSHAIDERRGATRNSRGKNLEVRGFNPSRFICFRGEMEKPSNRSTQGLLLCEFFLCESGTQTQPSTLLRRWCECLALVGVGEDALVCAALLGIPSWMWYLTIPLQTCIKPPNISGVYRGQYLRRVV